MAKRKPAKRPAPAPARPTRRSESIAALREHVAALRCRDLESHEHLQLLGLDIEIAKLEFSGGLVAS